MSNMCEIFPLMIDSARTYKVFILNMFHPQEKFTNNPHESQESILLFLLLFFNYKLVVKVIKI